MTLKPIQYRTMKEVVSSCLGKFKTRAIKCKKAAESCNNVVPSQDNGTPIYLCETLKRWHGLNSTAIITNFLNDLRNMDTGV